MHLTDYAPLMPYAERYAALPMEPLRVTLELVPNTRVVSYDPINLDNLLARMVLEDATGGDSTMPDTHQVYRLPAPLQALWTSEEGLPLYACTALSPGGHTISDVAYIHKRAQTGHFTAVKNGVMGISTTNGRWMDRRIPFPTAVVIDDDFLRARLPAYYSVGATPHCWFSDMIGNPEEIARLLLNVTFCGKRRAIGFGEVKAWHLDPIDSFPLEEDGCLTRILPEAALALLNGSLPEGLPIPIGWTPPQWKPSLHWLGWPAGTPVWRI